MSKKGWSPCLANIRITKLRSHETPLLSDRNTTSYLVSKMYGWVQNVLWTRHLKSSRIQCSGAISAKRKTMTADVTIHLHIFVYQVCFRQNSSVCEYCNSIFNNPIVFFPLVFFISGTKIVAYNFFFWSISLSLENITPKILRLSKRTIRFKNAVKNATKHLPPVKWLHTLDQRFSNCGPRTTSGPRVLPLWSF